MGNARCTAENGVVIALSFLCPDRLNPAPRLGRASRGSSDTSFVSRSFCGSPGQYFDPGLASHLWDRMFEIAK
jgi:hypothetical protein